MWASCDVMLVHECSYLIMYTKDNTKNAQSAALFNEERTKWVTLQTHLQSTQHHSDNTMSSQPGPLNKNILPESGSTSTPHIAANPTP